MNRKMLTVEEVATALCCSVVTVKKYLNEGIMPSLSRQDIAHALGLSSWQGNMILLKDAASMLSMPAAKLKRLCDEKNIKLAYYRLAGINQAKFLLIESEVKILSEKAAQEPSFKKCALKQGLVAPPMQDIIET